MNTKNFIVRLLSLMAVFAFLTTALIGCGKDTGDTPTVLTDCTVKVQSEGGTNLENVAVSVYADKAKTDLIDFVRTNADGIATLNADIPSGSVIFLTDVPEGYLVGDYYSLTEKDTTISLIATPGNDLSPITLGGVMFDFTVTDQNGTEYTLSKLLESKKAVVLNLWYINCAPCKMEFPFLQQAYNEYSNDIALLALNPIDNADAISAFATENNLSIPMASCDPAWAQQVANIAYPTTIVVDRFGTVALIHIGSIDNSKTFKNLFAHFTADDYQQSTFEDISSFDSKADQATLGTADNPYEHNGDGIINVTVEPQQTVYYSLYGADKMHVSVTGDSLKLVCADQEYISADGKITFTIAADNATVVSAQFTNTGNETATYRVKLSAPIENTTGNSSETTTTTTLTVITSASTTAPTITTSNSPSITNKTTSTKAPDKTTENSTGGSTSNTPTRPTTHSTVGATSNTSDRITTTAKTVSTTQSTTAQSTTTTTATTTQKTTPTTTTKKTTPQSTTGSLINKNSPIDKMGLEATEFSAEVKAGELVLYHLYRVSDTILRINDSNAYVIYEGKTYTPDNNGMVAITVSSDGPTVPVVVQIGNSGKTNKAFQVTCKYPEGHMMNPYAAKLGKTNTKIAANNAQGVFYKFTATAYGELTISFKKITSGVKYDFRVTNQTFSEQKMMSESADGKSVTIEVDEGDEIEINVASLPDEDFKYPAATVDWELSFITLD